MKSTRKMLALVLALVFCLALFPASASAAGIIASGDANIAGTAAFVLYTDGKLVINGQGTIDPMNQWSFSSWGGYASAADAVLQTRSEIKNLIIEEGITAIGASAFQECPNLTDFTLPVSLTAIGSSAFEDCSGLVSIIIPSNVQSIGQRAFRGCAGLTSVYLSDGLQTIGSQAFMDCTALTSITIPANVQQIQSQAFRNCGSLKTITFTGNFPTIANAAGSGAFQNVRADAYYPVDNDSWNQGLDPLINTNNADFGGRLTWHASAASTSSDGWVQKNGFWYYYMNGVMVRENWVAYQGFWFYFGENGRMLTGRQLIGGKYYYLGQGPGVDGYTAGVRISGWVNGQFYDDDGVWQPSYSGVNDNAQANLTTGGVGINYFRNGWQQLADGNWFYIRDKAKVKGWIKDGAGYWYYLDPTSGAMVTGWLTWNGNTYYMRPADVAAADGIPERVGSMVAGCSEQIGGTYYTFDSAGALQGGKAENNPLTGLLDTGWRRGLDANGNPGGGWYFYRSDNTQVGGGWERVGGFWYFFNDSGTMKTGWLNWNGDWYYLTPPNGTGDPRTSTTGRMVIGFNDIGVTKEGVTLATPKTYFFKSNGALNGQGWIKMDGKWYYLRQDGSIATGWLRDGTNWFYLDDGTSARPNGSGNFNRGEMVTGVFDVPATADGVPNDPNGQQSFNSNGVWIGKGNQLHNSTDGHWGKDAGGSWHYYDSDNIALTGWQYIGGKWYYLDPASTPAGKMRTGWFNDGTNWYYCDKDGVMQKGWQQIDGAWYYLDGNGARVTGWSKINGKWYYLDPINGAVQSGWIEKEYNGKTNWYYMSPNAGDYGAMHEGGWMLLGGKWFYLNPVHDDTYGCQLQGWQQSNGSWFFMQLATDPAEGWMLTGRQYLPEDSTNPLSPKHWYYLDTSDGHMLTNVTIDGHTYGADGREIGT